MPTATPRFLLAACLALLLLLSTAGCSILSAFTDSGGASPAEPSTIVTDASEIEDGRTVDGYADGRIGDTLVNEFFSYCVNSAELADEFTGLKPAEGYIFLVAELTVKNVWGDTIPMFSSDFQVQWGEGDYDYGYPIDKFTGTQMEDEYDMPRGQTITATVVYEIPRLEGTNEYSISYAEMAAITSGNTDLLDLAKIDKKIASMESERSSFIRSKSDTKSKLGVAEEKLESHKGYIENFKTDIELRSRLTLKDGDGNYTCAGLQIDGALNGGAKAMADRLHELERSARTGGDYEKIGTLGDFTVFVRTEQYEREKVISFNNTFSIGNPDKVKYTHNNGSMPGDDALAVVSFAKALDKIEGLLAKSEKTLTELTTDIPIYRNILDSPYIRDTELQALKVERDVLDRKIQLTLKPIKDKLAGEDAGHDEKERHDENDDQAHYDTIRDSLRNRYIEKYGGSKSNLDHFDNHIAVVGIPRASAGRKM